MKAPKPWFAEWFDSPFYHILYGNHDQEEANLFIEKLTTVLAPKDESVFLDLACGKGRHSRALNKLGFKTFGIDLSENSITFAKQFENENLHFDVHDMRDAYKSDCFDYVFNLFTSFGYFDNEEDLVKTLDSVNQNLKKDGILLIDYLNVETLRSRLLRSVSETIHRQGIEFKIKKSLQNGFVLKKISFQHERGSYDYTEKVAAIDLSDFERLLNATNFNIKTIHGDYELNSYNPQKSERLIIIAQKN